MLPIDSPMVGLSRYQIVRRIAEGGMGEVFLARQSGIAGFSREVVVKRIHARLARDPRFVQLFLQEARVAAQLDHSNVVLTYELGQDHDSFFMVMEHVDGLSLSRLLHAVGGPLPLSFSLLIATGVAEGLSFVHRHGGGQLVHRDVSPPNILISVAGNVKIADFGLAQVRGSLQPPGAEGRWAYLSPEQARGEPLDRRSDVFSLGLALYEMTTGQRALASPEAARRGAVVPPERRRPGYPADLRAVVMRALAPRREQRFPDCAALQDVLLQLKNTKRILGSPARLGRYVEAMRTHARRQEALVHASGGTRRRRPPTTGSLSAAAGEVATPRAHRHWVRSFIPVLAALGALGFAIGWLVQGFLGPPSPPPPPPAPVPAAAARPAPPAAEPLALAPDARASRAATPVDRPPRQARHVKLVELTLRVVPPVDVYLGRRRLGHTPLTVRLPRGEHTLRLRSRDLGINATRRVKLAGDTTALRLLLLKDAVVGFRLEPGLRIKLDGRSIGATPIPPQRVFEGRHRVSVTDPRTGERWEASFSLEPGGERWIGM